MSKPYNVFISFKSLGSDGRPTRDSALARELYDYLTGRNLSAFYSGISLEQLGISAYKKAIDEALDSSQVLVAVGTCAKHLDSQWVRYEWDSFFSDILSGVKPEGRVFVYLEGVEPAALPRALRQSQAISHGAGSLDLLYNFITNAVSFGEPRQPSDMPEHDRIAAKEHREEGAAPSVGKANIKSIEDDLKTRFVGQDAVVERLLPWIRRLRFGLHRQGRPAAVFLFLGPTGTGKTALAQELARVVFGDANRIVFLEMGQFKSKTAIATLIGAPTGYVGNGDGKLSNSLRDMPECVVLFDEIEKADPSIFGVIVRFADEGVVWDAAGPMRDGSKAVIVMSTNAGQGWLRDEVRSNPESLADPARLKSGLLQAALRELSEKGIRPEFVGRVDEVIPFLPLSKVAIRRGVDRCLERELAKFMEKGVEITVDETARDTLAEEGYRRSIDEGARAIPRLVNNLIVGPIIDVVSSDDIEVNATSLSVTAAGDGQLRIASSSREDNGHPA